MAMRENTGLQIALVMFVMVTVVLAVTTYLFWDKWQKEVKVHNTAKATNTTLSTEIKTKDAEIIELRKLMGYKPVKDGGEAIDKVVVNYETDMKRYAAEFEQKDYRAVPEYLYNTITALNSDVVKAKERADSLMAEVEQARNAEVASRTKYAEEKDALAAKLDTVRVDYDKDRTSVTGQLERFQVVMNEASKKANAEIAKREKKIGSLEDLVEKKERVAQNLRERDRQNSGQTKSLEQPDGRITWVSQRGGNVYLNIGSADGLRRSTSFTVLDAGANNMATAEAKASIEVTNIRGPHLSEARIIEDSLGNPILSGDVIYSPVWSPGQKTHFALVGFMDVDGDGNSDRDLVRTVISMNGGVIDAEVLDDGTWDGKLSINTRFLVQGQAPTDKSKEEAVRGFSRMQKEAAELGIEKISVERMLSDMGWRGTEQTRGGSRSGGGEFKPTPKSGTDKERATSFERRTRPGSGRRSSAY